MATLGIDFGSSYTTVSWVNPRHGKPETIKFNGDQSVKCPSVIMGTDSGLLLGFQAQSYLEDLQKLSADKIMEGMANFIPFIKRRLSADAVEFIGNKEYTHVQLLTEYFKYIKRQAEADCGSETKFDAAVISHPVDFEQANIRLLEESLHNSDFCKVSVKLEPIAAVQGYNIDHEIEEGQGLLVFDFGGGTIDVAFVKKIHGALKLLCEPKGRRDCGGQDFDMLLYEDLRKKILVEYKTDVSSQMVDFGLLNSCRRLKEYFSGPNESYETPMMFVKDGLPITFQHRLNREAFNNIIYQKAEDAVNVAKEVIAQTRQKKLVIDKVLLIGGSSQLTLVRELLKACLPEATIDTCGEKDVAVALGNVVEASVKPYPPSPDPNKVNSSSKAEQKKGLPTIDFDNDGKLVFEW